MEVSGEHEVCSEISSGLKMLYGSHKADSKPLDPTEWRLRESCMSRVFHCIIRQWSLEVIQRIGKGKKGFAQFPVRQGSSVLKHTVKPLVRYKKGLVAQPLQRMSTDIKTARMISFYIY